MPAHTAYKYNEQNQQADHHIQAIPLQRKTYGGKYYP